jgi:hypothetical protein
MGLSDQISALVEVAKIHEEVIEKIIGSCPKVQTYMIYKYLHAQGIRLDECDRRIEKLLREELKAAKP